MYGGLSEHQLMANRINTVRPVLSCHLKIDKTKIIMTNDSLMKVESIAECCPWSIAILLTCIN